MRLFRMSRALLIVAVSASPLCLLGCNDSHPIAGVAPPPQTADTETVTRVIDGDTFIAGDHRIRVLGINSCESKTPGGQRAKTDATALLNGPVTLTKQAGVDLDRYGRELRYVTVGGQDFGALMVARDHTEVYRGHNDASPDYVKHLRELDKDGKDCSR